MAKSYNKYQYETSPRKLEPNYAPKKNITEVKQKNTQKTIYWVFFGIKCKKWGLFR